MNKPIGWTSHDVVAFVRRRLGAKAGHAGTLDPMATGLLLILVGDATRQSHKLSGLEKEYRGAFELGLTTDTQDLEGRVLRTASWGGVSRERLERAMEGVAERGEQIPPVFSAIKRGGRPMYKIARQMASDPVGRGRDRALQGLDARPATVHEFRLENFNPPAAEFFLRVSKGFYVRAFCRDVGEALGCGAVLTCLARTAIGPYRIEDAAGIHDENLPRFLRPAP